MKCFKKITNLAIANEWIMRNPFAGIRFQEMKVNKEFLTKEEINRIWEKEFGIERLELVRDVFIFQCFTGLAFIDVHNLRAEHIHSDSNGCLWIVKAREKTDNLCNIPLLEVPKQILAKYKEHPVCLEKGVLLPVMCNQKMNSYLKEIADLCGIKKKLTTHTARHTFASSVALANNVSLSNVAKMLGHSSTRMSERYAKVLDQSILREMKEVEKMMGK
jgi:site-specific recombinase XerD